MNDWTWIRCSVKTFLDSSKRKGSKYPCFAACFLWNLEQEKYENISLGRHLTLAILCSPCVSQPESLVCSWTQILTLSQESPLNLSSCLTSVADASKEGVQFLIYLISRWIYVLLGWGSAPAFCVVGLIDKGLLRSLHVFLGSVQISWVLGWMLLVPGTAFGNRTRLGFRAIDSKLKSCVSGQSERDY